MVLAKYAKGQKALWLGNPSTKHSFTYVPDAGKAMAVLGEKQESDGSIWHLPTAPSMKGLEFIELAATAFKTSPRFTKVNKLMLQALGLFNPMIGETVEMYYQYRYDYIFDSSKFERAFGLTPTSYGEGIKNFSVALRSGARSSADKNPEILSTALN
jgi:nucleoside-diphosphate-sugar epimerase